MNRSIDTIIFDLGGVLIDWNPRSTIGCDRNDCYNLFFIMSKYIKLIDAFAKK